MLQEGYSQNDPEEANFQGIRREPPKNQPCPRTAAPRHADTGSPAPPQHGERLDVAADGCDVVTGAEIARRSSQSEEGMHLALREPLRESSAHGANRSRVGGTWPPLVKASNRQGAGDADVCHVEIGGTVGDIESMSFLKTNRQMRTELGEQRPMFVHLTLVSCIGAAGELKTRPPPLSVQELPLPRVAWIAFRAQERSVAIRWPRHGDSGRAAGPDGFHKSKQLYSFQSGDVKSGV